MAEGTGTPLRVMASALLTDVFPTDTNLCPKAPISKTLQLARPGKSPILISGTSSEEMAAFAAFILSHKKKQSQPVAEALPDLPASPTMPEIPPIGPQFMPYVRRSREPETTLARIASRTSEWSAPVPEELADRTDTSPGSSSSTSKVRQSQASVFHEVVHGLGPKLAYRKAMELMWNYDLEAACVLLDPWRSSLLWHAAAYAECSLLRTILTGRKSDAIATLELIKAAELLRDSPSSLSHDIFTAEILLMRSLLQVMLGQRLRALYNLRQSWYAYYRLEQFLESDADLRACARDVDCVMTYEDLRGRVLFGLGFFYMATSLIPTSLVPLIRLAGFVMHRQRGKVYLFECVELALGTRSAPAAILLAMYHLDLEPVAWHAEL